MAISLVGTATGTNTATPPTHQAGDLFLVFAYRDGNTTPPALASGFTNVNNAGGNTNSFRVGRKFASSSSDTVGTWTNATSVILIVLRGVNTTNPTGGVNTSNGASTTITYNSLTLADSSGSSWAFAFGGHRSTNVAIETVPTGMTLATSVSDATDEAAAFYLESATSFTSRTASVGGTSSGWISSSVEVRAQPPATEYTQSADITSSGSVSARKSAGVVESITSAGSVIWSLTAGKVSAIAGLASLSRSFGIARSLSVASSGAVTAVKAIGSRVAISAGSSASAIASRAYILAVAISSAASVSARRAIGKTSAITGGASVTALKAMEKAFALTSAGEASIRKVAGKMASVLPTSSLATQKAVDAQRSVSAASIVSLIKSLPVVVSMASAGVVSALKDVSAAFAVASSAIASISATLAQAAAYLRSKTSRGAAMIEGTFAGSVEGDGLDAGTAAPKRNAGIGAAVVRAVSGIIKRKR